MPSSDGVQLEKKVMQPIHTPLVGFRGTEVLPLGTIVLPVSLGAEPRRKILMIKFLVVDAPFAYNVILGKPGLNAFQAVVSTFHLKMKFPTKNRVGEVCCNQRQAKECYNLSMKKSEVAKAEQRQTRKKDMNVVQEGQEFEMKGGLKTIKYENRIEPAEEHKVIELLPRNSSRTTRIGSQMTPRLEMITIEFLRENVGIFVWSPSDLKGIDPKVIVHRLNMDPQARSVKLKK